jgi:hypothetical protein
LPTPPQVANGFLRPQSPMLSLEHIERLPASPGQPEIVAPGSQSCAELLPHEVPTTQLDAAPLGVCFTQQIDPAAQFALPVHASAVVSPPPPPAPASAQLVAQT